MLFAAAVYIQANLEDDVVKEALKTVSQRCDWSVIVYNTIQ